MAITVTCGCGKEFHVKDEHGGKRIICPVCKQRLVIPGNSTPFSDLVEDPPPAPAGRKSKPRGRYKKVFSLKLVIVLAGLCVLLVAVLVVVVAVSGSQTPSEVVKATFMNANEGRYSDANNRLSSQIRALHEQMGMAKHFWDVVTRKGSIKKVEILKEEIRGEGATVRYKIHFNDGKSIESQEDLVKESGNWIFVSTNYLLGATNIGKWSEKETEPKPSGLGHINSFLGISHDFKVYAVLEAGGVLVVDLETGMRLTSPTWDRDWGQPRSVAFGNNVLAVVTERELSSESVKLFSRKTGELEQNVRCQVNDVAFTADGRFLAITEFRPGNGHHLILRNIQEKKPIADLPLGSNGYCTLTVAGNRVAAYESNDDQITVVDAETGTVVIKCKSGNSRQRGGFGGSRLPLAISPAGNLIAFAEEDAVVLYNIDNRKVAHKLQGHLDVVQAVAFSPNSETVVSAAKDKTMRYWNVKEGKEFTTIKNLPAAVSELIFSGDGKKVAVVYGEENFPRERKAEIRSVEPN
jgi:Domain of unknown function (DUF4878)/WD domain, G-beta repeat